MLRCACFQRVLKWAGASSPAGEPRQRGWQEPPQSAPPSTPQTTKALADMLRDSVGRVRCPFGADFEEDAARATAGPQYRFHKSTLPWWLALLELHSASYRFGTNSDLDLPYVFRRVANAVASRRVALEAAPGGAPDHALVVSADLAQALLANPVFRHKVGAHALLLYALGPEDARFSEVTVEQLRFGGMMAKTSLLQPAAAAGIAEAFFEFVLKYRLETALANMSSERIQVLAMFHSQLLRRPAKTVGCLQKPLGAGSLPGRCRARRGRRQG